MPLISSTLNFRTFAPIIERFGEDSNQVDPVLAARVGDKQTVGVPSHTHTGSCGFYGWDCDRVDRRNSLFTVSRHNLARSAAKACVVQNSVRSAPESLGV